MLTPHLILLRMDKAVEKINTKFKLNNFFPLKCCRLWDNVEKFCRAGQARNDNKIRRMPFACWIPRWGYVILMAFRRQQWLQERASVLRWYVHCLSCAYYFRKILKNQISWKSVQWEPSCSTMTDRQRHRQTWWR